MLTVQSRIERVGSSNKVQHGNLLNIQVLYQKNYTDMYKESDNRVNNCVILPK